MEVEAGAVETATEHEAVPVEQVQAPNPVESNGPQKEEPKPEAKEDAPKRSSSVAEALKKADAEAKAKAESGDKPEPKEQKEEPKPEENKGPARDENGKFVAKDGEKPVQQPQERQTEPNAGETPQKTETAYREAPKRFDEASRGDWEKTPESVRGATHRTITELESGIQRYQQEYGPLKQYSELAKQHGTSIKDALDRYTGLERLLGSADPHEKMQGLQRVFDYAGVNPREFASRLMGQTPEQAQVENDNTIRSLRQELSALKQQIGGVTQTMQQQTERDVQAQVNAFATENPRFDELSDTIAKLLGTGMASDLREAYDMADRINPAPAQTRSVSTQTDAEVQTLKGSKSVTGAPTAGSESPKAKPSSSIKEALKRAAARAG